MRRFDSSFLPRLSDIAIACGIITLFLTAGCTNEEGPIPQALSAADLVPDKDRPGAKLSGATPENPDPAGAGRALAVVGFRYDRSKASWYIERFAKNPNTQLAYCALRDGTPADCTSFASQVLWYGGVPMQYASSEEEGWWYRYGCTASGSSKSWRQVNRLLSYLVTESGVGEFRRKASDLKVGDIIFYRLRREEDGYRCDGTLFNHSTVVSGFDARGEPLVAYHSNDALHVPWNVKNGSKLALGEACAFAFVHIKD